MIECKAAGAALYINDEKITKRVDMKRQNTGDSYRIGQYKVISTGCNFPVNATSNSNRINQCCACNDKVHFFSQSSNHFIWDGKNDVVQKSNKGISVFLTFCYNNELHIIAKNNSNQPVNHYLYHDDTDTIEQLDDLPVAIGFQTHSYECKFFTFKNRTFFYCRDLNKIYEFDVENNTIYESNVVSFDKVVATDKKVYLIYMGGSYSQNLRFYDLDVDTMQYTLVNSVTTSYDYPSTSYENNFVYAGDGIIFGLVNSRQQNSSTIWSCFDMFKINDDGTISVIQSNTGLGRYMGSGSYSSYPQVYSESDQFIFKLKGKVYTFGNDTYYSSYSPCMQDIRQLGCQLVTISEEFKAQ